ncbi:Aste57867_23473 [Aphanomyces stellatus]|uniref:Aste57867_23473 protein n=1 Tax=Aphanomyces stellatus TaxID=120398 RepID=A0A485LMX2_9STRA|nr:hypothetical protein As57867_023402 [Aphanomyces stellatus]VFU00118.1 Aste57867_23473 [Aphanomyces stellatus]
MHEKSATIGDIVNNAPNEHSHSNKTPAVSLKGVPILTPSQVLRPSGRLAARKSVVEQIPNTSIPSFQQCIYEFNALIDADVQGGLSFETSDDVIAHDIQRLTVMLGMRFFVQDKPCTRDEIQYGWNPFMNTFSIRRND